MDSGGKKKSCRPTWSISNVPGLICYTVWPVLCNQFNTRGHTAKIQKARCNFDGRRFSFSERVIDRWNRLQQEDIDVLSTLLKTVNSFKTVLELKRQRKMCLILYGLMVRLALWPHMFWSPSAEQARPHLVSYLGNPKQNEDKLHEDQVDDTRPSCKMSPRHLSDCSTNNPVIVERVQHFELLGITISHDMANPHWRNNLESL